MTRARRLLRGLLAAAAGAAPALAHACPACARDNGRWSQALLALMITFPIAVGFVVARVIHRAVEPAEEDRP